MLYISGNLHPLFLCRFNFSCNRAKKKKKWQFLGARMPLYGHWSSCACMLKILILLTLGKIKGNIWDEYLLIVWNDRKIMNIDTESYVDWSSLCLIQFRPPSWYTIIAIDLCALQIRNSFFSNFKEKKRPQQKMTIHVWFWCSSLFLRLTHMLQCPDRSIGPSFPCALQ